MKPLTVGFALCGSFCTFSKVMPQMENFKSRGINLIPIMSETAYKTDTRFGKAEDIVKRIEDICGNKVLKTLTDVEPIGPGKLLDLLIIAPCTGNTLGKLANGVTDTSVTLASKSHLRNGRPVLIAVSTNDALSAAAKNIGKLMNYKNIYFVPMRQDDFENKPNSVVADFSYLYEAAENALSGVQLQPLLL